MATRKLRISRKMSIVMGGVNNSGRPYGANNVQRFGPPQYGAQTSYGGYNAGNAFGQSPANTGYDTYSPSYMPTSYGGAQPDSNTAFVGGLDNQMAKATGGLDLCVNQALQADAAWKCQQQQQAAAAAQAQPGQPGADPTQAGQPGADSTQAPAGGGYDAIDKLDFSKMQDMTEDELKKAFSGLKFSNQSEKEYFVMKFMEQLSKDQGDDKGLNKIAKTLGIDHDDLTDNDFSAHDLHVIRDILNKAGGDDKKLGDVVDKFADGPADANNRVYIAKAVGSSSDMTGSGYFQKGDFGKVLDRLKQGQTLDNLIVEGQKK